MEVVTPSLLVFRYSILHPRVPREPGTDWPQAKLAWKFFCHNNDVQRQYSNNSIK